MSCCRKFTRRAAIGLLALGTFPSSSNPLLAIQTRPHRDRKSLDELLISVFSETCQQFPFFDSCRGLGDKNNGCLDTLKMNTDALYRAGNSATYIQGVVKHNISSLIRKDFQESNVVVVNGWVLSKTESAICAIIGEEMKKSQKYWR
jgi:hypothetical protein